MLLSLYVSNFLSFKEKMEFSFVSSDNRNNDTFFSIKKEYQKKMKTYTINKVNAIFWANASGKTNVLKSINFIKEMVLYSHNQNFSPSRFGYKPYALSTEKGESEFWVDFFVDDVLYSYSFIIDFFSDRILKEMLLEYKSQKATTLFRRNKQNFFISETFPEWKERKNFVRSNSLALSVFSNMSWEKSSKIWRFFKEKIHVFFVNRNNSFSQGQFDMSDTISMIDRYPKDFPNFLNDLLVSADTNINRMNYKFEERFINDDAKLDIPNNNWKLRLFFNYFTHSIYDKKWTEVWEINFSPNDESTWTNRLVSLSWSLYNVIKNWMTLFVDELDGSLHPLLVREIVSMFNWKNNKKGWQLVFTSHDVTLLNDRNILPKDQVRFVDKNKKWESSIYSLDDFNWVNSIANIEKAYLLWKFDAIPHINQF